jgi:phage tail sheath protein FI
LLLVPVVVALALTAAGCGGSEHDLMVRKFFTSAAAGDVATLGNIATVSFDPNKDGRAQNLTFVSETPVQTRVLKLVELDKLYKEAQAAETDFSKRMKEYQDKNIDAINRVVKIEQSGKGKPAGGDLQIQSAWTKFRDDNAVVQKAKADALKALQSERKVADLSLPDVDASTYPEATELTTEITYTANVRLDNQVTKKTLVLTFQRVLLKDTAGKIKEGNWMITGLKDLGAAQ